MSTKNKYFVIAGVIVCLVIAVMSPFIASSNPDGLEKSAEQLSTTNESSIYSAPLPDYTFGPLGKIGEIAALALGIIVTLAIAYVVALLLRRRNPPKASK
jgi:cobalt/nickel transport protein